MPHVYSSSQRTSEAVVYQARAADKLEEDHEEEEFAAMFAKTHPDKHSADLVPHTRQKSAGRDQKPGSADSRPRTADNKNSISQKKVAHALLKMASNTMMLHHFVNKGGVEAIYKLAFEADDKEVLSLCASCLTQACMHPAQCPTLVDKQIVTNLSSLIEKGDEHVKFQCARAIGLLSNLENVHLSLSKGGILIALQNLMTSSRDDVICYAALAAANICTIYFSPQLTSVAEAEVLLRLVLAVARRLDVYASYESAYFISKIFANISRVEKYTGLFVEEGALTILLDILTNREEPDIVDNCTETFVNLSLNRKNQREIASSGVSFQFPKILGGENVSVQAQSYCLMMIGNLLSAG